MCFLFAFSAKPFEWNEDSGFTVIGSFLLAGWVSLSLRRKSFFYFILFYFFFNFNPRFFKLFHTSTHRCAFAKWIGRPKSLLSVILLDLKTANLHFHTSIYEVFVFLFLFSMFCIVFDVSVFLFYFGSFDSGSSPDFVALKLFTYTLIHSHSHSLTPNIHFVADNRLSFSSPAYVYVCDECDGYSCLCAYSLDLSEKRNWMRKVNFILLRFQ